MKDITSPCAGASTSQGKHRQVLTAEVISADRQGRAGKLLSAKGV